jgi:2-polyprenyl-3-methyl-5-hydroxy-6-metoxy-1,4-benzoquinol methylase
MTNEELRAKVHSYKYYHVIKVTDTISTPGEAVHVPAQMVVMDYLRELDLKGRRVLDIGCRDGLFSFAAESLGAAEVIGIDNDISKAAVEFLIPYFQSRVQMREMNLYDLTPANVGMFDAIVFPGVLYHLRYPFWSMKIIRDVLKPGGDLLVETMIWDGMNRESMLYCPADTATDLTTCTLFNEKGLVDSMQSMGFEFVSRKYADMTLGGVADHLRARLKRFVKQVLSATTPLSVKNIVRGTFRFRLKDDPAFQNSFAQRYWDSTHSCHSEGAT